LQNKKLKAEFYFTTPATDVYRVSVYKNGTRATLTTDASGATTLPAGTTGKYVGYFDADNTGPYTLNITRTSGSTGPIFVTNVIVGPGIQPQGAVVGPWITYTPTVSGFGTAPTTSGVYRRIGDSMQIQGTVKVVNVAGAATFLVSIPTGFTANFSAISSHTTGTVGPGTAVLGRALWINNSNGAMYSGGMYLQDTTTFQFYGDSGALGWNDTVPSAILTTTSVEFEVTVPIAEWAGAGTVNVAQNDVEYAYNTSGDVPAGDTTSFGYGPNGVAFVVFSAAQQKRVRFQTPIQVGDQIELQISADTGATWRTIGQNGDYTSAYVAQGATDYGIGGIATVSGSVTDVTVNIGLYRVASGVTYGAAGAAWSAGAANRWRLVKSSAGAAVGFGIVVPGTSSGLVSASGLPGNTTGNAIASGYVGETPGSTTRAGTGGNGYDIRATTSFNTSAASLVSATLNKGVYLVGGVAQVENTGTARNVGYWLAVGGTQVSNDFSAYCGAGGVLITVTIPPMVIVITADSTVVDLRGQFNSSSTAASYKQSLHLARLA
jgi:hypothetical protein